ncbi:MAG: hypothetical protein ACYCVY_12715 [Acidiferrobacteraceae bacterium]
MRVVDDIVKPPSVTDQEVPLGRPRSLNVTMYVTCVNVTDTVAGLDPETDTDPV